MSVELHDVIAVDANIAWAEGDSGINLKTTDGSSWSQESVLFSQQLYRVDTLDAAHIWTV